MNFHNDPHGNDLHLDVTCHWSGTVLIILTWCEDWINESSRVVPLGGSLHRMSFGSNYVASKVVFDGYSHICRCTTLYHMYSLRARVRVI
jgi:hypothetical protein